MTAWTSSLGASALHPDWPLARFNVAGMFTHHPLILELMDILEQGFNCRPPIDSLFGAPAVRWNAGRASKFTPNPQEFTSLLSLLHSKGIGYFPTFTNHLVDAADLTDPICNGILDCIVQRPDLNAVIVVSDLISKYIADKYPQLRQVASIIKVTLDRGNGRPEYYRDLGQRFFRYVVHPDDCRNLKLLDQLDRDKAEIIVNENCVVDCPTRIRHYTAYARWQKATNVVEQQIAQQEINQITANCQSPFHLNRLPNHQRTCNLMRSEMKAIYDMGFRHFKIQGRADDPWSCAYDIARLLLEPDFVMPFVHKSLCHWLDKAVVKVKA